MEHHKLTKIHAFLNKFPIDTKSWGDATDELPDLHNKLAEYFPGYKGNVHTGHGGTLPLGTKYHPGVRNQIHRVAVLKLISKLSAADFEKFYEENKGFFEPEMAKGGPVKEVILTEPEDAAWDKWMGHFLTHGKTNAEAEKETVKILRQSFPRLQELLTGDYKIALETSDIKATGGGLPTYHVYYMDNDAQKRIINYGLSYEGARKVISEMYRSQPHLSLSMEVEHKYEAGGPIKGDTVIVNAGRFKDAEGKIVDMGIGGNNYLVEFPEIGETGKPLRAIVFPGDLKKKVIEKEFDKVYFLRIFNSLLDRFYNSMKSSAETEAVLIGNPLKTEAEVQKMAMDFYKKQLAKEVYEYTNYSRLKTGGHVSEGNLKIKDAILKAYKYAEVPVEKIMRAHKDDGWFVYSPYANASIHSGPKNDALCDWIPDDDAVGMLDMYLSESRNRMRRKGLVSGLNSDEAIKQSGLENLVEKHEGQLVSNRSFATGGPILEGIVTYKHPGAYSEAKIKLDNKDELLFVRWGDIQPFWEGDKITYEIVSEDGFHEPTGEITSHGGGVHFSHDGKVIKVLSINRKGVDVPFRKFQHNGEKLATGGDLMDQIDALYKLKYTDSKEGLFEGGETVTVKWMGIPTKGVIVDHIPASTSSNKWRQEYFIKLPGVEEPERFFQNSILEAPERAQAKEFLGKKFWGEKFWGGTLVTMEKGGDPSAEEKEKKTALAMIRRWQKKNKETGELEWKTGAPTLIKNLAAKFSDKKDNGAELQVDPNRYVVDVMYRDGANYKSFLENVLVPEEYIAEHGVPQVGSEVDMEQLCFTPNEFYNQVNVTPDDQYDHNILEITDIRKASEIPAGQNVVSGHNKYGDYEAGTFYAKGGSASNIASDDFVTISSPNAEYNGAKGMVLSVDNGYAEVELLELPVEGTHLRRTVKKATLEQLTKIDSIYDYVKDKMYKMSVPVDINKPDGPQRDVIVKATGNEGVQVWTETLDKAGTYLFFPDELIGNEVKGLERATGTVPEDMNTDVIEFKGKYYPVRTIVIKGHGLKEPTEVKIGTEDLEAAVKKSRFLGKAGEIDGEIYFYVPDALLLAPEKELASNLDGAYEIAEPSEYAEGGPIKGKRAHQKKKQVKETAKHISEPESFDIRISKGLAEKALSKDCGFLSKATIMCKEKGAGTEWIEVNKSDLVGKKLPSVYKTLEIWLQGSTSKEDCLAELKELS